MAVAGGDIPSVSELLDVDREYRDRAATGELQRIAPRRFNPSGEAWLPVLHTRRNTRRYTALFSNTARAHQTGNTRDWVVLYADNGAGEHRHTVITAGYGPLRGRRVVAGREHECRAVYLGDPKPTRSRHTTSGLNRAAHGLLLTRKDTADLLEDDAMTATRDRIEHLVVRIQSDFLDNPALALTPPAAAKRFGIDEVECAGVLGALVEARVLTEREGAYRRYFPPHVARRAA